MYNLIEIKIIIKQYSLTLHHLYKCDRHLVCLFSRINSLNFLKIHRATKFHRHVRGSQIREPSHRHAEGATPTTRCLK